MSNRAFPVASQFRRENIWDDLPREDAGIVKVEGKIWIGLLWGVLISGAIYVAAYYLLKGLL